MTVGFIRKSGELEAGDWYNLAATEVTYTFPILNFTDKAIVLVKAYPKQAAGGLAITVRLLDASDTILKTETLKDYDSGSSNNPLELITEVPVGSAKIRFNTNLSAFVFVQPLQYR
jgi:hypothetical protein